MLGAMDRRDPATAGAARAPDTGHHAPALLRKLADGTYRVEVDGEPGVPRTAAVHFSLVAALNSEARYVHAWRPVSEAERRAGACGPDVLYVAPSY
jgi:hypothetical protein